MKTNRKLSGRGKDQAKSAIKKQTMNLRRGLRFFGAVAVMTVLMMGCSSVSTSERQFLTFEKFKTIAVVPFFEIRASEKGQSVARCPVSEESITLGELAPEAPGVLTELFRSDLRLKGYRVLDLEERMVALAKLNVSELAPEALAQKIGRSVAADLVLMGWIFCYQERIGTAWGASRPAVVAFTAYVFGVEEGTVLWQGRYDGRQKTLSKDASQSFRPVKRAGRWETARQMATGAVEELLLSFPTIAIAE